MNLAGNGLHSLTIHGEIVKEIDIKWWMKWGLGWQAPINQIEWFDLFLDGMQYASTAE